MGVGFVSTIGEVGGSRYLYCTPFEICVSIVAKSFTTLDVQAPQASFYLKGPFLEWLDNLIMKNHCKSSISKLEISPASSNRRPVVTYVT